jgi:pseudouridine synthase
MRRTRAGARKTAVFTAKMSPEQRLQKALAAAGLGSRRKCEALIQAGRVKVNDRVALLGDKVNTESDQVTVDGVPLELHVEKKYFLLNKPAGYITSARDGRGRPVVMDLIGEEGRLFPVGRLDKNTRGLLLITNDGYFAHKVMHPAHGLEKTYLVEAEGNLGRRALATLRKGVRLDEGVTAPAKARVISKEGKRVLLEITISEGKKRQIRRMCDAVGLKVTDLVRTRLGNLDLKGVEEGRYRPLTPGEVAGILEMGDDAKT